MVCNDLGRGLCVYVCLCVCVCVKLLVENWDREIESEKG